MISILILTHQEERNLPSCLDALDWCDDIVVLDSFSTDATVAIARQRGARVMERAFDDFATQRNHGIDHAGFRHDWILHLDADEIVTPAMRDEMLRTVRDARYDAYRVASRLMFRGRWLRHAGMYPSYQVRLGRRDRLRFTQVGHGQREALPADRTGTLAEPLVHHSFTKGIADWVDRHNRYSSAEARHAIAMRDRRTAAPLRALFGGDPMLRRRAAKDLVARLPNRPLLRFLYMYVWRRGFLDGAAGYAYCRMLAMYELMIELKIAELTSASSRETP